MRAVVQKRYGSPEVLTVVEAPAPTAGPDEVRIQVVASPITQGDRRIRAGDFGGLMALPGRLMMGLIGPRAEVPGSMFAGTVESVGSAVTRFEVGDRVFGCSMSSALAELLVTPQDGAIAHIPDGVGFTEAAAASYGGNTAWRFLTQQGQVKPGDKVLVIGATGGVGRSVVQLARHLGAEVTAVCRGTHRQLALRLGAHHVVDRTLQDYQTLPERFDVIFDTSGTASLSSCRGVIADDGRFLTLEINLAFLRDALLSRLRPGPKALSAVVLTEQADIEHVAALLADGVLAPLIAAQVPMVAIQEAHHMVEAREAPGDVVVQVSQPSAPSLSSAAR